MFLSLFIFPYKQQLASGNVLVCLVEIGGTESTFLSKAQLVGKSLILCPKKAYLSCKLWFGDLQKSLMNTEECGFYWAT